MTAPRCYLVPEESLLYASRRHAVILASSIFVLVVALVAAVALWIEAPHRPTDNLRELALIAAGGGVLYFAWNSWHWWLSRYVITTKRIIQVEGLIARRIKSLPLRLIINTTYHRTLPGRLLGYCDLELNLSGQPGLRRLTRVPNADTVYRLILQLLSANESGAAAAKAAVEDDQVLTQNGRGTGQAAGRSARHAPADPIRQDRARDPGPGPSWPGNLGRQGTPGQQGMPGGTMSQPVE
ncbi:MAG: PH domain-containing protein [Actinomycetota bacterium]